MVAHRLVQVHAVEDRRVETGEQFVGDDQDLRVFPLPAEPRARVRLFLVRQLVLRHERTLHDIVRVRVVDRRRPFRGKPLIQGALVSGAGLPVHSDDERLVTERLDILPEVAGDEVGHFLDSVVRGEEGREARRAVENPVQLFDVRHTVRRGEVEELPVEQVHRRRQFARRQGMPYGEGRLVLDGLGDRVLVQVAAFVLRAEDLEGARPVFRPGDGRSGEPDDRGVREGAHQVVAQVAGHRAVRLVYKDEGVRAGVGVPVHLVELVDHREDEPPSVGLQVAAQVVDRVRAGDRDVPLLHLAEQPIHPSPQLPLEFPPVHDHDDGRLREAAFPVFQDQPGGGQQREGLAGALRVPDETAGLAGIGAAIDDPVGGAPLVLTEDGLPRFAVLHIEEDPVAQGPQEVGRLEERLDGVAVGLVVLLLPPRRESARDVPGDAVPVVEEVRHIEQLRRRHQLGGDLLVAPQLRQPFLDGVAILRVLVLHDRRRDPVHEEHHIGAARPPGRRTDRPLPGDPQGVLARTVEVHQPHRPLPLFVLVVRLPLAAQPGEHLPVSLDRRREGFESLDHRTDGFRSHPGIEPLEGRLQLVPEQRPGRASPFPLGRRRRERRPAHIDRMAHHRELHHPRLADPRHGHGAATPRSGRSAGAARPTLPGERRRLRATSPKPFRT